MGWQDYTVWAIGLLVAGVILRRAVCLFKGRGKRGCASCSDTKCPLKKVHRKQ